MGWLVTWPLIWLWDGSTWLGRCCHTQSNRERMVAQLLRVKGNIVWNEHKVKSLVSVSKHHSVPHKLGCYCVSVKKHPDTFLWACCEELLNYLSLCCLSRELFSLLMKHFKDGGNPSDKEVFEASSFERRREREVTVRHCVHSCESRNPSGRPRWLEKPSFFSISEDILGRIAAG